MPDTPAENESTPPISQKQPAIRMRKVRFLAFQHELAVRQKEVSYSDVISLGGRTGAKLKYRGIDIFRLFRPYVQARFYDQVKAVLPLAIYLNLFQILILRENINQPWVVMLGLIAVIAGLMMFMEGLKLGLMPFSESIGSTLPTKSPLPVVLLVALLLGIAVTLAEPAISALQTAGAIVRPETAPYLYEMLNNWHGMLVLVIGLGVGLAAVVGTLRFLYGWSLKPLILLALLPAGFLSWQMASDPYLSQMIGLAWDCGAVTTGPVTVPLVLALGIGIAGAAGKGGSPLSGFGIVTLASLFPVIGVLLLATHIAAVSSPEEIIAAAKLSAHLSQNASWFQSTPWQEILGGLRAVVPLVAFLLLILHYLLGERLQHASVTVYGISLCLIGMIIFNLGLTYGLTNLGSQSGSLVPAAFTHIDSIPDSPLYLFGIGITVTVLFAWFLGFGATLAEPALNALGMTVENLTQGAFRKSMLIYAVSIGVGLGLGAGILKVIFSLSLAWMLIPGYLLAVIFTIFSSEEFVNIAWDSAGVTTGPVTVPLVLAMGLGLGDAVSASDGFGILALASIGPILSVLATGLWVKWSVRSKHAREEVHASLAAGEIP
jgi:hypothetical protein